MRFYKQITFVGKILSLFELKLRMLSTHMKAHCSQWKTVGLLIKMAYKLHVNSQFTEERKHFLGIPSMLFKHKALVTF
jgi:hypothetical protein